MDTVEGTTQQVAGPTGRRDAGWRGSLRVAAVVWSVSYLAYGLIALAVHAAGATADDGSAPSFRQLDAIWYELIAQHGYLHTGQPADQGVAFFPLYPLLVRAADVALPGGTTVAAIAVSAVAYLAALTVLHRLAASELEHATATRALCCLALYPTAFFLAVGYNMSVYLLLFGGSVYALRQGYWWLGAAIAGLATATRTSALVLVVAFGWEYVRQVGWRPSRRLAALALVPSGLLAYAGYLWAALGDPLAFAHAQRYWSRHLDWPWVAPARTVVRLAAPGGFYNALDLSTVALLLAALVLACVGGYRLATHQRLYPLLIAGLVLLMISFPVAPALQELPLKSAARHSLEAFPAFLMFARVLRGRRWAMPLAAGAALLQVLLLSLFLIGKWAE
jgi:Gpi18-like mannosyltransferase